MEGNVVFPGCSAKEREDSVCPLCLINTGEGESHLEPCCFKGTRDIWDICGCHTRGALGIERVGARDTAQQPTVPRMAPQRA